MHSRKLLIPAPFSVLQIRFVIVIVQEMLAEVRQIKCQTST